MDKSNSTKEEFEELVYKVDQLNSDYRLIEDYVDALSVAYEAITIIEHIRDMYNDGKIKFESN